MQFNIYLKRLNDRMKAPIEHHARAIAIEVLVEMLKAFALATKVMRENRFSKCIQPHMISLVLKTSRRVLPSGLVRGRQ